LQQINVMARLIGKNTTILRPGPAPWILFVVTLVSAPSNPNRSHNEFPKATLFNCFSKLHNWKIESILLYHKKPAAISIARLNHVVSVIQAKSHWFLNKYVLSERGKSDDMIGVIPTFSQDRHKCRICFRHHFFHVGKPWNSKTLTNGPGSILFNVTNSSELSAVYFTIAEQLRMTFCNSPASDQCDVDHGISFGEKTENS